MEGRYWKIVGLGEIPIIALVERVEDHFIRLKNLYQKLPSEEDMQKLLVLKSKRGEIEQKFKEIIQKYQAAFQSGQPDKIPNKVRSQLESLQASLRQIDLEIDMLSQKSSWRKIAEYALISIMSVPFVAFAELEKDEAMAVGAVVAASPPELTK